MLRGFEPLEARRLFTASGFTGDPVTPGNPVIPGDGGYVGVLNTGDGVYVSFHGFVGPPGSFEGTGLPVISLTSAGAPARVEHHPDLTIPEPGPTPVQVKFSNGKLTITGTSGDDYIRVGFLGNSNALAVTTQDGQTVFHPPPKGKFLAKIEINANAGNDQVVIDPDVTANAKIKGGSGDDTLIGGAGNDTLSGGSGDDDLSGADGRDQLHGDDGNDTLDGGAGNDFLYGDKGNDLFVNRSPFQQANGLVTHDSDLVDGGKGVDLAQRDTPDLFLNLENDPQFPPIVGLGTV